jgi:transcriptional regulator with XRE-family HTH domain
MTKLSRLAFAEQAGLDASLLRSYECARSQLNYAAAYKVIMAFGINPEWLATGNGRMWLALPIPGPKELSIGARMPFSEIYQKHLAKVVTAQTKEWESKPPPDPLPIRINAADPRARLMAEAQMVSWIQRLILCLPDSGLEAFLNFLYLEGTKLARSYPADTREAFEKRVEVMDRARAHIFSLTDTSTYANLVSVKQQMPSLLERLNQATKDTGKMSALADYLGVQTKRKVPLASVSRWLSGKREPGGEITLLLERWVEKQERQK